jgi:hypothetical protein
LQPPHVAIVLRPRALLLLLLLLLRRLRPFALLPALPLLAFTAWVVAIFLLVRPVG